MIEEAVSGPRSKGLASTFTTHRPGLDRAETVTTVVAVIVSSGLYLRYRHPYLARGVLGDLLGLLIASIFLATRQRRFRHEALVCLAGIGAVHAAAPRWPLRYNDFVWWSAIVVGLTAYLRLRQGALERRDCI